MQCPEGHGVPYPYKSIANINQGATSGTSPSANWRPTSRGYSFRSNVRTPLNRASMSAQLTTFQNAVTQFAFWFWYCR